MARDKVDYRQKEPKELLKLLKEKEKELDEAKISFAQGKQKNVHQSLYLRKEIARIKTIFKEKEV